MSAAQVGYCAIPGCGVRASVWLQNVPGAFPERLGVCAAHHRELREYVVALVMADPEVRGRLGLPATSEEGAEA